MTRRFVELGYDVYDAYITESYKIAGRRYAMRLMQNNKDLLLHI
jgi:hypothetical protein